MNPFGLRFKSRERGVAVATMKRIPTKYPGVFYIEGKSLTGKPEQIFYIRYRRDGKMIEEKVGRQFQDDMTPARANAVRWLRIRGKEQSNQEQREVEKAREQIWTVSRLWEEYKKNKPSLKGIVTDENRFQKHIAPILGAREAHEIVPLDVDRLWLKMLKTHKPATVRNVLELLRRIINFGVSKRISQPIGFTIEMPVVSNLKTEDLTPEELTRLLQAIEEDSNTMAAALMKMALFTGMRRGELFSLQWDHIDFYRGFILLQDPKGGVDQRIPLNDAARQILEGVPRDGESPFVFPGRSGQRRVDIKKQVNRIKERAGLPKDFRALHGLRHVYASMLASSGEVDLYTLQKLMTHKSFTMTARYAHLRDDALKQASALAERLVKTAHAESGQVVAMDEGRSAKG